LSGKCYGIVREFHIVRRMVTLVLEVKLTLCDLVCRGHVKSTLEFSLTLNYITWSLSALEALRNALYKFKTYLWMVGWMDGYLS